MTAKFELGQVIVTPTACEALNAEGHTVDELLSRHCAGDWGDVSAHERTVNDQGLDAPMSLQSIYRMPSGKKVSFVTRSDRSLTLVHLLPADH